MVLVASISIFRLFACPPQSIIILYALHGQINEPETFFVCQNVLKFVRLLPDCSCVEVRR
jgi:hypothetical protein